MKEDEFDLEDLLYFEEQFKIDMMRLERDYENGPDEEQILIL